MSTLLTRTRQPKGRPVGGQFAGHTRSEAGVELTPKLRSDRDLNDREILELASLLTRQAKFSHGLSDEDVQDITQETIYSVLKTQHRNGKPIRGGLIRLANRAIVSSFVDTHKRHEDSRALRDWKLEVQRLEGLKGRSLTHAEMDAVAVEIRETWKDPRHKPSVGFQHETKIISSDGMTKSFADTQATTEQYVAEGSDEAHEFADQVDSGEIKKDVARRRLWNVLGEQSGAPESIHGSLTESEARRYASAIQDAFAVASLWEYGDATEEQATALFAPFGDLTLEQRGQVAKTITSRPKVGHKLWRSALDYSNRKYVE